MGLALFAEVLFVLLLQAELHKPTNLKLNGAFGRNLYPFEGFGVLGYSSCSLFGFEHTEITEFQAVITAKLFDDVIEKGLYNLFDHNSFIVGLFRNPINQLFFRDGRHLEPLQNHWACTVTARNCHIGKRAMSQIKPLIRNNCDICRRSPARTYFTLVSGL